MTTNHTIAAVSTGEGGAIAMIRMSGQQAIEIADRVFRSPSGRTLSSQPGFTLAYGNIVSGAEVVDDVVVSVFRAPKSYTGEDMVEISCHGSKYIKQRILALLVENGAQPAAAGEFTMRAFLAGKLDLSQAEAVADLIAAESRESHSLAMKQMRGGYSEEFRVLREQLLELAALLELELDFGEEDVEFADREKLAQTIAGIKDRISSLKNSFSLGNVLKKGVPVAIIGSPNVGKSTLLNALLNEERAMVSDIAGTTRDIIEDTVNIHGVEFRFIDTAGIRSTDDILESMGIERTLKRIASARIILYVFDHDETAPALSEKISELGIREDQQLVLILNKIDALSQHEAEVFAALVSSSTGAAVIPVSARSGLNIDSLKDHLYDLTGVSSAPDIIVTNTRHYEALLNAEAAIIRAQELIASHSSSDLLAEEIRDVIYHTGLIVGKIVSEEVLQAIFGKFCVGK